MRAKIDPDGTEAAGEIVARAYDDDFFGRLGAKFKIDALGQKTDIRRIGRNYILYRRFEDSEVWVSTSRKSYRSLLKVTDVFLRSLKNSYKNPYFFNIATEMLMTAQSKKESEPQTNFRRLTEHQRVVEAYYRELVRLTKLLQATLERGIKRTKPKTGPKPDIPLQHLVISSSVLWTTKFGRRRFGVDYHKGAGVSDAFQFVQMLLNPLDDIAEKKIITAMRTVIAGRGRKRASRRGRERRG